MTKTIDQLQAEIEKKEAQLSQERHKEQRLKNRLKYYEKGERIKRTHRLCNLGGTVESLAPEVKELTRTEMCELIRRYSWTSKNGCYESPCAVTGGTIRKELNTGLEEEPKCGP